MSWTLHPSVFERQLLEPPQPCRLVFVLPSFYDLFPALNLPVHGHFKERELQMDFISVSSQGMLMADDGPLSAIGNRGPGPKKILRGIIMSSLRNTLFVVLVFFLLESYYFMDLWVFLWTEEKQLPNDIPKYLSKKRVKRAVQSFEYLSFQNPFKPLMSSCLKM